MNKIPDKLYFKIGEVAELANVEPYVLRFWQKEFRQLNPQKNVKGQRRFTRKDVELVLKIAHLRYKEKYTIAGIKKLLREKSVSFTASQKVKNSPEDIAAVVSQIRRDAEEMLEILGSE